MNIYISNLSFTTLEEDLKGFFIGYGEVSSARIITDKLTNRSRGFGFVEMSDDEASKKAIAGLDGSTVDGRVLRVSEARQKEQRAVSSSNDDNRYNNSTSFNKNAY